MEHVPKGEDVCEHGEDPGDGVKVRDEADAVQVVEQGGVVEGLIESQVIMNKNYTKLFSLLNQYSYT